jgi:2-oxoglutarate ferredoxin oxidoreductase subunit gamma
MKRIEIKIGGIGGQGVVYAADLLGFAASRVYHAVAVSASYGAEARGTITTTEVVISDKDIDYPHIELPNFLIIMHQKAYDALRHQIAPDGCLVIDQYLTKNISPSDNQYLIPATQLAQEKLKDLTLANLILVGGLVNISRLFTPEILLDAYKTRLEGKRASVIQKGLKALQLGLDYNFGRGKCKHE